MAAAQLLHLKLHQWAPHLLPLASRRSWEKSHDVGPNPDLEAAPLWTLSIESQPTNVYRVLIYHHLIRGGLLLDASLCPLSCCHNFQPSPTPNTFSSPLLEPSF